MPVSVCVKREREIENKNERGVFSQEREKSQNNNWRKMCT